MTKDNPIDEAIKALDKASSWMSAAKLLVED